MRHAALCLTVWVAGQLGLGVPRASGAEPAKPSGHWEGTLSIQGTSLRLVLNVTEAKPGGGLKATFDSPDQGSAGLPVDSVAVAKGELTFALKAIRGEYKGKVDAGGTEAVGTWTQAGQATPLTLKKTETPTTLKVPADLFGNWEGTIEPQPGAKLKLTLRAIKRPDGAQVIHFASPDQGAPFLPINAVGLVGAKVSAESKAIGASFAGTLNKEKTEIVGTWTQGGNGFPITFKKVDKPTEPKRSQVIKPPFPYRAEEVAYENKAAGLTLAGTFTRPEGAGPFPAALLITGSGPQDRDETLLGHRPFLVIADALTRRGVAVLRVDDRGVGKSTGDHAAATSEDFARDVEAGVAYLKSREEVDPKAIGLIGHSEGGLIAPIVAARSSDVGFIVLLAGTGVDGATILRAQGQLILKAEGASESTLASQAKLLEQMLAIVADRGDAKAREATLGAVAKAAIATIPEPDRKLLGEFAARTAEAQIRQIDSPWFRFFLGYDPRTTLAKVRCPVLAINGEKDLQVPAEANLAAIEAAVRSGGNTRVTVKELPGLNHLFQACKTGSPSEYATIEETVNPSVLALLGDWIAETTGRK